MVDHDPDRAPFWVEDVDCREATAEATIVSRDDDPTVRMSFARVDAWVVVGEGDLDR